MLNQNQSKKSNSWKYALILPALIAFVLLFQIEVVAQEKETNKIEQKEIKNKKFTFIITKNTTDEEIKKQCEQVKKIYNIDLSFFNIKRNLKGEITKIESKYKDNKKGEGNATAHETKNEPIKSFEFFHDEYNKVNGYNMNLTSSSERKEVYINGEKSSQEELDKLDAKEIETVNVIKSKKEIHVFTKSWLKSNEEFTFYIDDKKVTPQEYYSFNREMIESSHGNLDEKTIRIITKNKKDKKIVPYQVNDIVYIDGEKISQSELENNFVFRNIKTVEVVEGKTNKTYYVTTSKSKDLKIAEKPNEKPLIILDGHKNHKLKVKDIQNIDPNSIEQITVLKDKNATNKYGEEGKNGVIEITTKEKIGKNGFSTKGYKLKSDTKPNNKQDIQVIGLKAESSSLNADQQKTVFNAKNIDHEKILVIVDGKKSKTAVSDINPDSIESINVLKDKSAEDKYGEEGKNGVIEITTKSSKK